MMYGFIGKFAAVTGQRDALISVLSEMSSGVPGCLSYVVARDPAEADVVWITEVWESKAHHSAALELPKSKDLMARCIPLIATSHHAFMIEPVSGYGLR